MSPPIDWTSPAPRPGLAGTLDRLIGPGATRAEMLLQFPPAFLAGAAAVPLARASGVEWSWLQMIVASFLAFDLTGGVLTNATCAAKRWFHKDEASTRGHLEFIAPHVLHAAAAGWLFRGGDWPYILFVIATLFAGALLVLKAPLYLRRPLVSLMLIVTVAVDQYGFGPTPGLAWFGPLFFFKLWYSYLLPEAPFATPDRGSGRPRSCS